MNGSSHFEIQITLCFVHVCVLRVHVIARVRCGVNSSAMLCGRFFTRCSGAVTAGDG